VAICFALAEGMRRVLAQWEREGVAKCGAIDYVALILSLV
jgi:hypothetical protein